MSTAWDDLVQSVEDLENDNPNLDHEARLEALEQILDPNSPNLSVQLQAQIESTIFNVLQMSVLKAGNFVFQTVTFGSTTIRSDPGGSYATILDDTITTESIVIAIVGIEASVFGFPYISSQIAGSCTFKFYNSTAETGVLNYLILN